MIYCHALKKDSVPERYQLFARQSNTVIKWREWSCSIPYHVDEHCCMRMMCLYVCTCLCLISQLLSLARALLSDSKILVLDDITAVANQETVALIQTIIDSQVMAKTTIITVSVSVQYII